MSLGVATPVIFSKGDELTKVLFLGVTSPLIAQVTFSNGAQLPKVLSLAQTNARITPNFLVGMCQKDFCCEYASIIYCDSL